MDKLSELHEQAAANAQAEQARQAKYLNTTLIVALQISA